MTSILQYVASQPVAIAMVTLVMCPFHGVAGCAPDDPGTAVRGLRIDDKPDWEGVWHSPGQGFAEWNAGGWYMYASGALDYRLDLWTWNGTRLEQRPAIDLPKSFKVAWWRGHGCVYRPVEGSYVIPNAVCLRAEGSPARDQRWSLPRGWYLELSQPSRNGLYVALGVRENVGHDPPDTPVDFDWDRLRLQLYMLGPKHAEPHLVMTVIGVKVADCVRTIMPSDDGAYVALAGWDNGLLMVDVKAGKELWRMKPPKETALSYVDFAPDNKVAYAGGIDGCVYAVCVQTGRVLNQWFASPTGQYEYGHIIEYLAASPDGRWVAVGTGPEGLVFVGSTTERKLVKILKHGNRTVELVQFSPDSKALASWDRDTIKTWNVSRWDASLPTTTQPASTQPTTSQGVSGGPHRPKAGF